MLAIGVVVADLRGREALGGTRPRPQGSRPNRRTGRDRGRDRRRVSTTCSPATSGARAASSARSRSGRAGFDLGRGGGRAIAVIVVGRRRNIDMLELMDTIAAGSACASNRALGNYFNQGLRPADHVAVGPRDRRRAPPGGYSKVPRLSNRRSSTNRSGARPCSASSCRRAAVRFPKRGQTFALYIALYTFGVVCFVCARDRRGDEDLRRALQPLMSAVLCAVGAVWVRRLGRRPQAIPDAPAPAADVES